MDFLWLVFHYFLKPVFCPHTQNIMDDDDDIKAGMNKKNVCRIGTGNWFQLNRSYIFHFLTNPANTEPITVVSYVRETMWYFFSSQLATILKQSLFFTFVKIYSKILYPFGTNTSTNKNFSIFSNYILTWKLNTHIVAVSSKRYHVADCVIFQESKNERSESQFIFRISTFF